MNKNNILSEILYKKRMSYRDLSRLSGVSKSAIDKIVKCEADPKTVYNDCYCSCVRHGCR